MQIMLYQNDAYDETQQKANIAAVHLHLSCARERKNQEHVVTWRPGWWSEQCHQHATPGSTNDTCGMGGVSRKRRVRSWDPMGCLYQLALVWGLLLLILCYPLLFIESEPLWLKANSFSKPCSGIIGFRNAMSFWLVTTIVFCRCDVSCFP